MRIYAAVALGFWIASTAGAQEPHQFTRAEQETFLANAKVVSSKSAPGGITGSRRAKLDDGQFTHDAHIQSIDETRSQYMGTRGMEINFRDTYKYNVAAYRLDQLLELNMVPVTVARKYAGKDSSFTWWTDDVLMDEARRVKKKENAPNPNDWNSQMYMVRVFDQLIFNTDRNLGNLLITKDWHLVMIDHTRAFRTHTTLQEKKNLVKCDSHLLAKLKELNEGKLKEVMGDLLTEPEIKGILARRDKIVEYFDAAGPSASYTYNRQQ